MIAAIIQARMLSTRLPGKVMKDILGKPMIGHLLDRVKASKMIDKIIVATSDLSENDVLCDYVKKIGFDIYRGSENDVLDRYYQTAKLFNADIIVRITADCPLIDPKVADKVVQYYLDHKEEFDYVSNTTTPTYPDGLDTEVFSFDALEKTWNEAKKRTEREYVTSYIWKNGQIFRLANVAQKNDLSPMRWTVDEESDFLFVKKIYEELYQGENKIFLMEDIVDFLQAHPEVMSINQGIKRNEGYVRSLKEEGADIEKEFLPWEVKD